MSYWKKDFGRLNEINRKCLLALAERKQLPSILESDIVNVTDSGGRPNVLFRQSKFGAREFDYIVYALGGTTPTNFLKTISIEFEGDAPILKNTSKRMSRGCFCWTISAPGLREVPLLGRLMPRSVRCT